MGDTVEPKHTSRDYFYEVETFTFKMFTCIKRQSTVAEKVMKSVQICVRITHSD